MKSNTAVRDARDVFTTDTHLIFYHRITKVLNQTPEHIFVLHVREKTLYDSLLSQRLEILKSTLEFPEVPIRLSSKS